MPSRDRKIDSKHKKNQSTYMISYYRPYLTSIDKAAIDEKDKNEIY